MKVPDLASLSQTLFAESDYLKQQLRDDPLSLLSYEFEADPVAAGLPGIVIPPPIEASPRVPQDEVWRHATQENVLRAAGSALDKIEAEGVEADFSQSEALGLEAIILLVGRPAIFVQNGSFFPPPTEWSELELVRPDIEASLARVGRVELDGHPNYEWIGTGFLVADDVIMTNEHVAREFVHHEGDGWCFRPNISPRLDFREELGTASPFEFAVQEILAVHPSLDLALLRVASQGSDGAGLPSPLTIASAPPTELKGRKVYTIGYPAWDGRRNDPDAMRRIFSGIYNVKRLQPGEMRGPAGPSTFFHDCSTLGGNSGSAVVDLETHHVLGLHFSGRYLDANRAVALWELINDATVATADLNFV